MLNESCIYCGNWGLNAGSFFRPNGDIILTCRKCLKKMRIPGKLYSELINEQNADIKKNKNQKTLMDFTEA